MPPCPDMSRKEAEHQYEHLICNVIKPRSDILTGFDGEDVDISHHESVCNKYTIILSRRVQIILFATLMTSSFGFGCMVKYCNQSHFYQNKSIVQKHVGGSTSNPRTISNGSDDEINHQENGHRFDYIPLEREKRQFLFDAKHGTYFAQENRRLPMNINEDFSTTSRCIYHYEGLVHPGMFAHSNPRRIAITGDGNISILREVIKHKTVEYVATARFEEKTGIKSNEIPCIALDSDPLVRDNDCKVEIFDIGTYESSFSSHDTHDDDKISESFDVIIMNADSSWQAMDSERIEQKLNGFIRSVYDSLSPDGVLIVPLGDSPFNRDSVSDIAAANRETIISSILKNDFESIHLYEESHGNFNRSQSYAVAFKSYNSETTWHVNEAVVNVAINKRILRTKSGLSTLNNFDGATMSTYQRPPKAWETLFCRSTPMPFECGSINGFDPMRPNISADKFEVKASSLGENVGRGIFTTEDIPEGAYIMQEVGVHSVQFPPLTADLIETISETLIEAKYELDAVISYMYGYGYESYLFGETGHFVDSGISTFTNHGCNRTYTNMPIAIEPRAAYFSEGVADPNKPPMEDKMVHSIYNPIIDRRAEYLCTYSQKTVRDIKKGEELLENYLFFTEDAWEWAETVRELKAQCTGEEIGLVVIVDKEL